MDTKMKKSKHAQKRMQQRGITDEMIALIEIFGVCEYQEGGSEVLYMKREKIMELRKALDKMVRVQVIASNDETIVTVQHKY